MGLAALDPQWAGGRPRLISRRRRGRSSSRRPAPARRSWASRSPAGACASSPPTCAASRPAGDPDRPGTAAADPARATASPSSAPGPGRSPRDPDQDAKLDRIEDVTSRFPDRCLRLRPVRAAVASGPATAPAGRRAEHPDRLPRDLPPHPRRPLLPRLLLPRRRPAVGRRPREHKGGDHTLAALKSIRAARPDGAPIYVDPGQPVRATRPQRSGPGRPRNKVELCFTPTNASWANPIEAQFGPLRTFTMANSNHPNHTVAGPPAARLPALAQRQRPPPRRPGRPTPRTRPHPQRTPTTLGPTPTQRRLTNPVNVRGQRTSRAE